MPACQCALALQGSASASMALQGSASARMALQGSASARMALQDSPSARFPLNPCLAAGVGRGHICEASGDAPRYWLPVEPAGHAQDRSACMRPVLSRRGPQVSTVQQFSKLRLVLSRSHIRPDCCLSDISCLHTGSMSTAQRRGRAAPAGLPGM